jgi:hypothetical protein
MNGEITVSAECRAETIERTVLMRKGEASVTLTLNYAKPYIVTAKSGEGENEIFTTENLGVQP